MILTVANYVLKCTTTLSFSGFLFYSSLVTHGYHGTPKSKLLARVEQFFCLQFLSCIQQSQSTKVTIIQCVLCIMNSFSSSPIDHILHFRNFSLIFMLVQCAFSALTLLVGRQEGHPVCKKLSAGGTGMVICLTATTTIILRPFVRDYLGKPVPEETSPIHHPDHHPIFISFHLPRSILLVQITCLAIFLHNVFPCS